MLGAAPARTLWVVSELYAPELTSTGYFITHIAQHLATDRSRRVRAVASQPTYSARGLRAPREEFVRGVHVRRVWSPALKKDSVFGRIGNLVAFSAQSFWELLRSVQPGDTILAVTNPPPLPYIAALIARWRRARFVLLVHDMYPEVLLAGGMATGDSAAVKLLDRTSRWLYGAADRIVVLGRDMHRLVAAKLAAQDSWRVKIIPNWASLDEVRERPLCERSTSAPLVVQHAGNMGRGHDVEILMESAKRLPGIDFVFIGEGAKRARIERESKSLSVSNVRVGGYKPRSELSHSLGDCDIAAISFVSGMSGVSVPSRMYNVLAAGRPIIAVCEADSELALVVNEEEIGWVVPPANVDALVAALQDAASSRDGLATRGKNARKAAEEKYSEEIVMRAYDELFRSVEGPR